MTAYDRKHQHPEPRPVKAPEPTWLRALIVAGIVVLAVVVWSVIIWGVAAVIDWLASLPVLLLSLADKVVMSR